MVRLHTIATSAATGIASDLIRGKFGIEDVTSTVTYKEYFSGIDEIDFQKLNVDKDFNSLESLKQILDTVLIIVQKIGFKNTVILFDKIDEFKDLKGDLTRISNFSSDILSDTELLMNNRLGVGFSLWSELKNELSGKVRFDKFGKIDVSWKSSDLVTLINKRIHHFSIKRDRTLENLISYEEDRKELLKLANKSPRDLISALGAIYQEQSNTNAVVNAFDSSCITIGLINYCKNYDYDSIYPSNIGKNKEILSYNILYLRKFTLRKMSFRIY